MPYLEVWHVGTLKIFEEFIGKQMHFKTVDLLVNSYDYRRPNWDVFRDQLAELDWNELVEDEGLDNSILNFDTDWHKGLLVQLKAKGLPPSLVNWFESYPSSREIVTTVDGITSSARTVDRGVSQGSVLGPLLFLIFIDDLSDNISATMRLFPDDASLYRVTEKNDIRKVTDQVNKDLLLIYEWSITWKLYLNIDKCKAMIFSIRERDTLASPLASLPPVLINKSPISYVVEQKQLCLILRSNLDWTAHVNHVLNKVSRLTGLLKLHTRALSRQALDLVYKSFVLNLFTYASAIYGNTSDRNLDRLESAPYKAARAVSDAMMHSSKARVFRDLGWEPLRVVFKRHRFDVVRGSTPNTNRSKRLRQRAFE
ncbi:unnamed protein product [Didymodactylos carnosus]|uniref:Reverse transcriptase domain-containing protein n=1 Tax=Didymodactylos carnosus TaxID=1234261 RepID=A0A814ZM90_9BILA|nr:unnamed protein product [Didymodactylos carnosus]CAF4008296.1 unnamed protein product [Didymodactylos carnosus]